MQRRLLLILALVLAAAACGRGIDDALSGTTTTIETSTTTTEPVLDDTDVIDVTTTTVAAPEPITVWVDAALAPAVVDAAAAFTAVIGIGVVVEDHAPEAIRAAATTRDGPDVFFGSHRWLGDLIAADAVEPVELDTRSDELLPVPAQAFRREGLLYGLPVTIDTPALFFDPRLVPDAPIGFSQIKATCEDLGDGIDHCLRIATDEPMAAMTFVLATGGYLFGTDDNGDPDPADLGLATGAAVTGAGFVTDLVAEGFVEGSSSVEETALGFASGRTAFAIGGSSLERALADRGASFSFAPIPLMGGEEPRGMVDTAGFYLRAGSDDAAATFLREYLATPGTMAALYDLHRSAPAYGATASGDPAATDEAPYLEATASGVPVPAIAGIDDVLEALAAGLTSLFEPEADPAASMAAVAESVGGATG